MPSSTNGSSSEGQPAVGTISDGAVDRDMSAVGTPDIIWYDAEKDAESMPKYTRQYLRGFSMATNARLRLLDDAVAYFPMALTRTRRIHKWLTGVLVVLGLLWLGTAIVILLAVFRGNGLH